ncbi:MAG: phosphatase PAP2 family protein [Prevotellaceae bacterium]|nr:phosphatase PAP2 family protein [Prevotella sp.]MDD7606912.1 phosphatase PAP2 family protein [Prevotellaceae bacterium]
MSLAVSYSRIYLGVHYPGDVLAGALLGAAIGTLAYGMALGLCWALPRLEVRYVTLLMVCVFSMHPVHAQRGAGCTVHRVAATSLAVSAPVGQTARPAMQTAC